MHKEMGQHSGLPSPHCQGADGPRISWVYRGPQSNAQVLQALTAPALIGMVRRVYWLLAGRQSAATVLLCYPLNLSQIIMLAAGHQRLENRRVPSPVTVTLCLLASVLQ